MHFVHENTMLMAAAKSAKGGHSQGYEGIDFHTIQQETAKDGMAGLQSGNKIWEQA